MAQAGSPLKDAKGKTERENKGIRKEKYTEDRWNSTANSNSGKKQLASSKYKIILNT